MRPGWPEAERVDSSPKPDHAVTIQITRPAATVPSRAACIQTTGIFCRPASCPAQPGSPCGDTGRAYQARLEHLRDALDRLASALAKNSGRVHFPLASWEGAEREIDNAAALLRAYLNGYRPTTGRHRIWAVKRLMVDGKCLSL